MNKIVILLVYCAFFKTAAVYGQNTYLVKNGQLRDKQIDQGNSEKQIKELKNNFLLIRLSTRQPLIDALEKSNRHEEATLIKADQLAINQEIIAGFRTYFDFCPTYFFYSNYSDLIREKKLDSLPFLNDSARADHSIQIPKTSFYIAEFALLKQDTAIFETDTYLVQGEDGLEQRKRLEGGGNFGFGALVFKSSAFYQLRKPFPYYSRTLASIPFLKRTYKRVIQRANEALHYYYNQVY